MQGSKGDAGKTPTSFEDFIDETTGDFSSDIILDGVFVECISWGGKVPGLGNVPNQMINYFNTQSSLSNFMFQFDPERWVPSPSDLNAALKAKKGLFDLDKFNNGTYLTIFKYDVNKVKSIDDLIDFITSSKFNEIINPI